MIIRNYDVFTLPQFVWSDLIRLQNGLSLVGNRSCTYLYIRFYLTPQYISNVEQYELEVCKIETFLCPSVANPLEFIMLFFNTRSR
jgi:hypothetical protein